MCFGTCICNSWVELNCIACIKYETKMCIRNKKLNVLKRKLAPMLYNLSLIKVKLRKERLWWLRLWRFTRRAVYGVGAHHAVRELTHEINKRCFICLSLRIKCWWLKPPIEDGETWRWEKCGSGYTVHVKQLLGAKIKWQSTWNKTIGIN